MFVSGRASKGSVPLHVLFGFVHHDSWESRPVREVPWDHGEVVELRGVGRIQHPRTRKRGVLANHKQRTILDKHNGQQTVWDTAHLGKVMGPARV